MISASTQEKYGKLQKILQGMESVVVGFSGGVDSTFLTYVAHQVLGKQVLAVTAVSATLPEGEKEEARRLGRRMGVSHLLVPSHEFSNPDFVANPPDRCYICKKIRFTALATLAREKGYRWVIDGGNVDDLGDYRPGLKALRELSACVRSPMIEAGLHKADIRALSQAFHLPTWNKQSAACLASRIPYGVALKPGLLQQIDRAEEAISPYIQGSLRVRCHGDVARIEVSPDQFAAVLAHRETISKAVQAAGFRYVTLDLNGYAMGSLNQEIASGDKK